MAADVICFTRFAAVEDKINRFAMVKNIQPVADVFAVAVNGNVFAFQSIGDDFGNEFFRMLFGAVIVGTIGDGDVHSKGVKVRTDNHVRAGFGGRIRRVWRISGGFGKETGFPQSAVNLIG